MDMEITDEILNGTFEQKQELVCHFNLMDDDFMAHILQDKAACQYFLRTFTKIDDSQVINVKTHYTIDNLTGHSVELDVLAKDSQNRLYNIEIQVNNHHNDLKRARYYQSCIDCSALKKGRDYNDLPEIYTIYITSYDIFGLNHNHYEIDRMIHGTDVKADNGVHELYFNTKVFEDNEFAGILEYLKNSDPSNMNFGELSEAVRSCKGTKEGVDSMCQAVSDYGDRKRELGIKQGIKQGRAEGRAEGEKSGIAKGKKQGILAGKVEDIINMRKIGIDLEQALKVANITRGEYEKYLDENS